MTKPKRNVRKAAMADAPFIWRFKDGLNELHDWPTKGVNTR